MADEPVFLTKGIDVSAKYKGAFCEAKVRTVEKSVKCKVTLEDGRSFDVSDDEIKGVLKVNTTVEVRPPGSSAYVHAVLNRIMDRSMYTVVFNDGDVNRVKRSKLRLKGNRHFTSSETFTVQTTAEPELPNNITTSTPKKLKQKASSLVEHGPDDSDAHITSLADESKDGPSCKLNYNGAGQNIIGRAVLLKIDVKNRKVVVPGLVVLPRADETVVLPSRSHVLVRSFKDGRFVKATTSEVTVLTAHSLLAAEKRCNRMSKHACEKARTYLVKNDLPADWDACDLLGYDLSKDISESDAEVLEKRVVAQLYRYMDDQGTSPSALPTVAGRDINLSKLFCAVHSLGGYSRVTSEMKWHVVYSKLRLPYITNYTEIRDIYKKYLHDFEVFYRKFGQTATASPSTPDRRRPSARNGRVSSVGRVEGSEKEDPSRSGHCRKSTGSKVEDGKNKTSEKTPAIRVEVEKLASIVKMAASKTDVGKDETPKWLSATRKVKKKPYEFHSYSFASSIGRGGLNSSRASKTGAVPLAIAGRKLKPPGKGNEERVTRTKGVAVANGRLERKKAVVVLDDSECSVELDRGGGAEHTVGAEKQEKGVAVQKRLLKRPVSLSINTEEEDLSSASEQPPKKLSRKTTSVRMPRRRSTFEGVYAVGTRLKVRYGEGRNLKSYTAKVLECKESDGSWQYKVHYDGWNSRHDDWVTKDAVICLLKEPSSASSSAESVAPKDKQAVMIAPTTVQIKKLHQSPVASPVASLEKRDKVAPPARVKDAPESVPLLVVVGEDSRNISDGFPDTSKSVVSKLQAKSAEKARTRSNTMDSNSAAKAIHANKHSSFVRDVRKSARQSTTFPTGLGLPEYLRRPWHASTSSEYLEESYFKSVAQSIEKESNTNESADLDDNDSPLEEQCSVRVNKQTVNHESVDNLVPVRGAVKDNIIIPSVELISAPKSAGVSEGVSAKARYTTTGSTDATLKYSPENLGARNQELSDYASDACKTSGEKPNWKPAFGNDETQTATKSMNTLSLSEKPVLECFLSERAIKSESINSSDSAAVHTAVIHEDSKACFSFTSVVKFEDNVKNEASEKLIKLQPLEERSETTLSSVHTTSSRQPELTSIFPTRKRRLSNFRRASGEKRDSKRSGLSGASSRESHMAKVARLALRRNRRSDKNGRVFSKLKSGQVPVVVVPCCDPLKLNNESKVQIKDEVASKFEKDVEILVDRRLQKPCSSSSVKPESGNSEKLGNSEEARCRPSHVVKNDEFKHGISEEIVEAMPIHDVPVHFERERSYEEEEEDPPAGIDSDPSPRSSVTAEERSSSVTAEEEDSSGSAAEENNSTGGGTSSGSEPDPNLDAESFDRFETLGDIPRRHESRTGFNFGAESNEDSSGSSSSSCNSTSVPNYDLEKLKNAVKQELQYDGGKASLGVGNNCGELGGRYRQLERRDEGGVVVGGGGKSLLYDAEMMLVAMSSQPSRAEVEERERGGGGSGGEHKRRGRNGAVHRLGKMSAAEMSDDSDDDEEEEEDLNVNDASVIRTKLSHARTASNSRQLNRFPSIKYDFVSQVEEELQVLEGEARISLVVEKIEDLRSTYMRLKAEVASIDRRKKRHRLAQTSSSKTGGGAPPVVGSTQS